MKILVIDDSPAFQMAIISRYTPPNHIVEYASNGADGVAKFTKFKPDVVLLDIVMPIVGGKEAIQKLLNVDPAAKIIIVSGCGSDSLVTQCMASGALAFVSKPFKMEQIDSAIKDAIEAKPRTKILRRLK